MPKRKGRLKHSLATSQDGFYRIARLLHFSYGHRLLGHPGKCRRLHGHNAEVAIFLKSNKLDRQGMVMDFECVDKTLGVWLRNTLDHQMILEDKDPLVPLLQRAGETVCVVPFSPTAENLARWIFHEAKRLGLPVVQVAFQETHNASAFYQKE